MSGLVRRLVIFAISEGLVLQAHGHPEHHKSLLVSYETSEISERARNTIHHDHDVPRLEAHGLIGIVMFRQVSESNMFRFSQYSQVFIFDSNHKARRSREDI